MYGSSPRVWGIRTATGWRATSSRFIPTCVGNTNSSSPCPFDFAVHPHVCGEYDCVESYKDETTGSSPRVWGIRLACSARYAKPRFIPTCVGNTRSGNAISYPESVHPHVCGEYIPLPRFDKERNGSSPRVWGIRTHCWAAASTNAVHPHVCGEYWRQWMQGFFVFGSSPRVWGILLRGYSHEINPPVHPHVCGEYGSTEITTLTANGSSPRVWGILNIVSRYAGGSSGSSPRVWGILDDEMG